MPEPTVVWQVDLVRGRMDEREGTLILESESLLFRPAAGVGDRRVPLRDVRRVKRLLASPVLIVHHGHGATAMETAYYFVEPPPLQPPTEAQTRRFGTSRRKAKREAVQRLTGSNRDLRHRIRGWEAELKEAVARVASGGSEERS